MSERLRAVVDRLDIRSDERVLEIGCGHGVAATLVCERLEGGRLTAVDRSEKMIGAATRRNAVHVEAGRAEFLVANLENLDLGDRRLDKVYAVRVGLFHREPGRARGLVERWLAPGGRVFVFFDEPSAPEASEEPRRRLRRGFTPDIRRSGAKGAYEEASTVYSRWWRGGVRGRQKAGGVPGWCAGRRVRGAVPEDAGRG